MATCFLVSGAIGVQNIEQEVFAAIILLSSAANAFGWVKM